MSSVVTNDIASNDPGTHGQSPRRRALALADRLEQGAGTLAAFAKGAWPIPSGTPRCPGTREHGSVTKAAALELLERNSTSAAAAVRALSDEQLDRAAPVSLNEDAPLTCQFLIEDHALRHSFHHLAAIRAAVTR